jgi:hypothetical protein
MNVQLIIIIIIIHTNKCTIYKSGIKLSLEKATKVQRGSRGIALLFL